SDLLAASSALAYLRSVRAGEAPEAARLSGRIQTLVAGLLGLQNGDGGWPWVGGRDPRPSERLTSARVVWALSSAEPLGLLTDPKALDKAATFLTQEFARAERLGGAGATPDAAPGTAPSRPRRWRPWRWRRSGRRRRSSRRRSSGWIPGAAAPAGSRTRPRDRPWRPWPPSTARPRPPRTA